ncbi:MAG: hypothetical protein NZ750_00525 [Anaerolineae bacterium]|nr:hypothetical protein [Anaerolineae bacterium]MDW8173068.1 hypothetical protein [Anaerolineae bacterium]
MPLMPSTPPLPTSAEIDAITNLLLERETPMTTAELAHWLIETRLESERQALQTRYQNIKVYDPAEAYNIGDRLTFSKMDYALATVSALRPGNNPDYGDFEVISVEFDEPLYNGARGVRDFAARLAQPHALNGAPAQAPQLSQFSAEDVLKAHPHFIKELEATLSASKDLRRVAGYWFPQELVIPVDIGMLHLAEAVLDVSGDKPMTTQEIIEQIGGLGNAPMSLQVFSMNVAMSQDKRFDEVGPLGQVLWYLHRQQPEAVRRPPVWLQHRAIDFDPSLLSPAMRELEMELNDELSKLPPIEEDLEEASLYLIYPHRRAGTLPINRATRQIVPTARTPRIFVEIVDDVNHTRFPGWVVHEHQYVYGLLDYYTQNRLSIGTRLYLRRGEHPGQLRLRYDAYKPRREFIPVVQATRDQLTLTQTQRPIGAEYDMQLIVGIDNLEATDELTRVFQNKNLATILKAIIAEAGKFSPQGTVHAKTIYSLANVFRRVPPGLVFATLAANPDFHAIGDVLWKLNE